MDKQLRRILDLVRKTGDRMVVTDANGEDVYVVMGLDQYENLLAPSAAKGVRLPVSERFSTDGEVREEEGRVGPMEAALSEETAQARSPEPAFAPPADIWDAMPPAGTDAETWDLSKLSDVEMVDLERQFENYQQEKAKPVLVDEPMAEKAIESKSEPKDEDFGEEQFYLEPVE